MNRPDASDNPNETYGSFDSTSTITTLEIAQYAFPDDPATYPNSIEIPPYSTINDALQSKDREFEYRATLLERANELFQKAADRLKTVLPQTRIEKINVFCRKFVARLDEREAPPDVYQMALPILSKSSITVLQTRLNNRETVAVLHMGQLPSNSHHVTTSAKKRESPLQSTVKTRSMQRRIEVESSSRKRPKKPKTCGINTSRRLNLNGRKMSLRNKEPPQLNGQEKPNVPSYENRDLPSQWSIRTRSMRRGKNDNASNRQDKSRTSARSFH